MVVDALGRPWEQCWKRPQQHWVLSLSIWVPHYSFSSPICLLSNYPLSTYYVLSPGANHEHSTGLLYLHIAHVSRSPSLSDTAMYLLKPNLTGACRGQFSTLWNQSSSTWKPKWQCPHNSVNPTAADASITQCALHGLCAQRSGPPRSSPHTPVPPLPSCLLGPRHAPSLCHRVHKEEVTQFTSSQVSQTYRKIMSVVAGGSGKGQSKGQ